MESLVSWLFIYPFSPLTISLLSIAMFSLLFSFYTMFADSYQVATNCFGGERTLDTRVNSNAQCAMLQSKGNSDWTSLIQYGGFRLFVL